MHDESQCDYVVGERPDVTEIRRMAEFIRPPMVDMVNHPPHYTGHPSGIQCIEIARHMTFGFGNALKYLWRADLKNGREDLAKARWYLVDAAEHADPVFLHGRRRKVVDLLHRVIAVETDPHRLLFFESVLFGSRLLALQAVNQMLDTG